MKHYTKKALKLLIRIELIPRPLRKVNAALTPKKQNWSLMKEFNFRFLVTREG